MQPHEGTIAANSTSPRAIRIEIARRWNGPLYLLASKIPLHPVTLSAILNGRQPLKPELAARIMEVLRAEEAIHAG